MSGINVGRVIVGGLAAGFVANVFDFIITPYLLANELAGTIARLNLNAAAIESSVWAFVIVDFIWGLLLVFTYAAIRPRFGPGPKTAIISGVLPWIAISPAANNRLQRTLIRRRGRSATASFHYALAARWIMQRAAAEPER
jgi:hypothetical protein